MSDFYVGQTVECVDGDRMNTDKSSLEYLIEGAILDASINNMYATCPYLLRNGAEGAYGPNTCHGGCHEEPECVTGGPYEEEDISSAIADAIMSNLDVLHEVLAKQISAPNDADITITHNGTVGWLERPVLHSIDYAGDGTGIDCVIEDDSLPFLRELVRNDDGLRQSKFTQMVVVRNRNE